MKPFSLFALVLVLLAGCDDGSGGPGELTGMVRSPGPSIGAVVLEVHGKGITGFSGLGASQAFYEAGVGDDTYRVVVLSSSSGQQLQFRVEVEDVGGKKPSATVVSLASGDNLAIPATAEYRVEFTK